MQRREFLGLTAGMSCAALIHPGNDELLAAEAPGSQQRIPIIYSTDLFHPPDDADDHVDQATLFSLPELDVRGIVLDLGHHQQAKSGEVPVKQMAAITGKEVPYAPGLIGPLRYPEDKAENQDLEGFGSRGIELILRALPDSNQIVYIFSTGSCRDVAAAFQPLIGLQCHVDGPVDMGGALCTSLNHTVSPS